mmetsp:Transcript_16692/g.27866  ORF Transcript_16692/g.27866 Transcript_16692/m.27866 type:complete len:218 (-) Transcript_16692:645-1298(-)
MKQPFLCLIPCTSFTSQQSGLHIDTCDFSSYEINIIQYFAIISPPTVLFRGQCHVCVCLNSSASVDVAASCLHPHLSSSPKYSLPSSTGAGSLTLPPLALLAFLARDEKPFAMSSPVSSSLPSSPKYDTSSAPSPRLLPLLPLLPLLLPGLGGGPLREVAAALGLVAAPRVSRNCSGASSFSSSFFFSAVPLVPVLSREPAAFSFSFLALTACSSSA